MNVVYVKQLKGDPADLTNLTNMELIGSFLENLGNAVALVLDFTSIFCIIAGFIAAIVFAFKTNVTKRSPLHTQIKIKFGSWLSLALQFLLASDIVISTISPTYENLIKLGALAIIRTFLNYFLNKELYEEIKFQDETRASLDKAVQTSIIKKTSTIDI
jgi:uncharacterized membrane protein